MRPPASFETRPVGAPQDEGGEDMMSNFHGVFPYLVSPVDALYPFFSILLSPISSTAAIRWRENVDADRDRMC